VAAVGGVAKGGLTLGLHVGLGRELERWIVVVA
jgi:hypothetical protein